MSFIDEINNDIAWRMSELASLKTIPLRYNLLPEHKELLIKYSVPSIYSLWEGFVRNAFELYIREINKLSIPIGKVQMDVLAHTLSSIDKLSLENPRLSFRAKKEFIEFYHNTICNPLIISYKLPTKSNIDFKIINEILLRFNLAQLPKSFEGGLQKFLRFRNSIAHGDMSIPVKLENVEFFSKLVIDLMSELLLKIEEGFNNRTFLKVV